MNIYDSYELHGYISQMQKSSLFLKKRYGSPTKRDLRENGTILVDYSFGKSKVAPFISSKSKGVHLDRDGYATATISVPRVGVRESVSFDDLDKRLPGEDPFKPLTYAEREKELIKGAYQRLDEAITNREEQMFAEMLTTHKLTITEHDETALALNPSSYTVDYLAPLDTTGSQLKSAQIELMNAAKDSAFYIPETTWDESSAHIIKELKNMIDPMTKRSIKVTDLLIDANVRDALLNNNEFMDLFKAQNYGNTFGTIAPQELADDATLVARINVYGKMLNVICYEGTYTDYESGEDKAYLPKGSAILCAPNLGHFVYGAVSMYPQGGKARQTFLGQRVPKLFIDADNDTQELRLYSHPLCVPEQFAGWTVGKVLKDND